MVKYDVETFKNPRYKRLAREHEMLDALCQQSSKITYRVLEQREKLPPEKYEIIYYVKSITGIDDQLMPLYANEHTVEISLPAGYPVSAQPRYYANTPIWHPNIKYDGRYKGRICVQEKSLGSWVSIADLVLRIGELIQYKTYHAENVAPFPEDEKVAEWVREFAEPKGIVGKDPKTGPVDPSPLMDMETGSNEKGDSEVYISNSEGSSIVSDDRNKNINLIVRILPSGDELDVEVPVFTTFQEIIEELQTYDSTLLPKSDPEGNPYTYEIVVKELNQKVEFLQTFKEAGVEDGATILIMPRLIAGGSLGKIIFEIPEVFEIGEKRRAEIRIAKQELENFLLKRELMNETQIKEVEISDIMRVTLVENSLKPKLTIKGLNETEQIIGKDSYTQWNFDIYPTGIGVSALVLKVSIVEVLEKFGERRKDVFFFDVEVSIRKKIENAKEFTFNWQSTDELMDLMTWNERVKEKVQAFIVQNESSHALALLANYLQGVNLKLFDQILLLQSQLNEGKNLYRLNLINPTDWLMMQNKVNFAILEILKDIETEAIHEEAHILQRTQGLDQLTMDMKDQIV